MSDVKLVPPHQLIVLVSSSQPGEPRQAREWCGIFSDKTILQSSHHLGLVRGRPGRTQHGSESLSSDIRQVVSPSNTRSGEIFLPRPVPTRPARPYWLQWRLFCPLYSRGCRSSPDQTVFFYATISSPLVFPDIWWQPAPARTRRWRSEEDVSAVQSPRQSLV